MPILPDWTIPILQVVTGLAGVYLLLRRDRREIRNEANSRLEKIDHHLLHLDRQVSYMAGRLDEQRSQEYKNTAATVDKTFSEHHRPAGP